MAVTVTTTSRTKDAPPGFLDRASRNIVFDSSYPTGGEVVLASDFGMKEIIYVYPARLVSGFSAAFAHVDTLRQTDGSLLLRLRAAAGTEVPNATDASTVACTVIAEGH